MSEESMEGGDKAGVVVRSLLVVNTTGRWYPYRDAIGSDLSRSLTLPYPIP
jgi:hypothetical protein